MVVRMIGPVSAVVQALAYCFSLVVIVGVWPRYGVASGADVANPALVLVAVERAPVLQAWDFVDVVIGISLLILTTALAQRHDSRALVERLESQAGLVAAALFIVVGMLRFVGYIQLAVLFEQDAALGAAAYGAVNAIQASVDSAAVLALGGWLLLVNSDFVRGRGGARVRASLGLLAGCASLLAAVVPGAGPVGLALVLVWFAWLALDEVRTCAQTQKLAHGGLRWRTAAPEDSMG